MNAHANLYRVRTRFLPGTSKQTHPPKTTSTRSSPGALVCTKSTVYVSLSGCSTFSTSNRPQQARTIFPSFFPNVNILRSSARSKQGSGAPVVCVNGALPKGTECIKHWYNDALWMLRYCGFYSTSSYSQMHLLHIHITTHPILRILERACSHAENGSLAVSPQKYTCVQALNVRVARIEMPPEYFTANSVMLAQIAHAASPDRGRTSLQLL